MSNFVSDNYSTMTKELITTVGTTEKEYMVTGWPYGKTLINFKNILNIDIIEQQYNGTNDDLANIENKFIYAKNESVKKNLAYDLIGQKLKYSNHRRKLIAVYGSNFITNINYNYNLRYQTTNALSRSPRITWSEYIICNGSVGVFQLCNSLGYGAMPTIISVIRGGLLLDIFPCKQNKIIGKYIRSHESNTNCQFILNHNNFFLTDVKKFNGDSIYISPGNKIVLAPGIVMQGSLKGMQI